MAQLRNVEKVWEADPGTIVTVGHNRTIEPDDRFYCRLHGHTVAIVECKGASGIAYVTLDTCGFMTSTTRQAMNDFLGAFGITARASIAGGKLSIRYKMPSGAWREKSTDGQSIKFVGHRYV